MPYVYRYLTFQPEKEWTSSGPPTLNGGKLRLVAEGVFQDLREPAVPAPSASSARAPSFIIAEQVGDIRNRHTPLQADARERVPETVRRGGFFKRPGDIEGLGVARRIRFRAWAHAGRS